MSYRKSAASKAWETRRLNAVKKGGGIAIKKQSKFNLSPSDPTVYVVQGDKVVSIKTSAVTTPQMLYGSMFEATMVARFGPNWWKTAAYKKAKKAGEI
jgi:hypothetical protein